MEAAGLPFGDTEAIASDRRNSHLGSLRRLGLDLVEKRTGEIRLLPVAGGQRPDETGLGELVQADGGEGKPTRWRSLRQARIGKSRGGSGFKRRCFDPRKRKRRDAGQRRRPV